MSEESVSSVVLAWKIESAPDSRQMCSALLVSSAQQMVHLTIVSASRQVPASATPSSQSMNRAFLRRSNSLTVVSGEYEASGLIVPATLPAPTKAEATRRRARPRRDRERRKTRRKPEPRHNVTRVYPEACAQAVRLALNLRANGRR